MKENNALEENQDKEYNTLVNTYTFTCQVGDIVSQPSPVIEVHKAGIHLHFLRYGLFDRNTPFDSDIEVDAPASPTITPYTHGSVIRMTNGTPELEIPLRQDQQLNTYYPTVNLEEVTVLGIKELPKNDNFYVARTAMREGYLYLIDEADPQNNFLEYEIDALGFLHTISFKKNKDTNGNYKEYRTASKKPVSHVTVKKGSNWSICYSPVQWGLQYLQKVTTDTDYRKKRMKRIACTGFTKGEEQTEDPHILPYYKADAVFDKESAYSGSYHKTLQQIYATERAEEVRGNNETLEDMFIILDDPLGCAKDMNEALSDKVLHHQALIAAIQSGETQQQAYDRISKGDIETPTPKKAYYGHIYSLALTTYQMIYNDAETIQKYDGGGQGKDFFEVHPGDFTINRRITKAGTVSTSKNYQIALGHGVNREKIHGILGINQRAQTRSVVNSYRKDLATLLQSDYFKPTLDDYLHSGTEKCVEGRDTCMELLDHLGTTPMIYERHLLLPREYTNSDQWVRWVWSIIDSDKESEHSGNSNADDFKGIDPLYVLLGVGLNLEKIAGDKFKTSQKIAGVYTKRLKHLASLAFTTREQGGKSFQEIDQMVEFTVKKLNKNLKVYGKEMFEVRKSEIHLRLEELGVEIDPKYVKSGKYTGKKVDVWRILKESEGIELRQSQKGKHVLALRTMKEMDEETILKNARHERLAKMVNGRAFNGVFALLEIYNFSNAILKIEGKLTRRDYFNIATVSIKLSEASLNLTKAFIKDATSKSFRIVSSTASVTGAIGAVFTASMCFWDATEAYGKKDDNKTVALIGAGVAFTVAAGVSITATAATIGATSIATIGTALGLAGPIGWIAAGIGVGLLLASELLTDTPMEYYFKHYLFSDYKDLPINNGETPMRYIERVYQNRGDLVDKDSPEYAIFSDPYKASATLLDMTVCNHALVKIASYKKSLQHKKHSRRPSLIIHAEKITVQLTFLKFFNKPEQLDYKIYYFENGIWHGSPQELSNQNKPTIVLNEAIRPSVQIKFEIPKVIQKSSTSQSDMLFVSRLTIDQGLEHYFPYTLEKKQPRWLGALFKIAGNHYGFDYSMEKKFVISTLDQLKTPKAWQ